MRDQDIRREWRNYLTAELRGRLLLEIEYTHFLSFLNMIKKPIGTIPGMAAFETIIHDTGCLCRYKANLVTVNVVKVQDLGGRGFAYSHQFRGWCFSDEEAAALAKLTLGS